MTSIGRTTTKVNSETHQEAVQKQLRLLINEDMVREHFEFLGPDGGLHLVATPGDSDDRKAQRKKQRKPKDVSRLGEKQTVIPGREDQMQFLGTVEELLPILQRATDLGDACHVTVNATDGTGGRKEENITGFRFLFADFDAKAGHSLPDSWPLQPTRIVETSPGSCHCYWRIADTIDRTTWARLQGNLVASLGCDQAVKDAPRILRIAGTWNQKSGREPFLVHVVEGGSGLSYTAAELEAAFGKTLAPKQTISERAMLSRSFRPFAGENDTVEESLRKIEECLSKLHPDWLCKGKDSYDPWLHVGMCCYHATGGDHRALEAWDRWSKQGRKYEPGECDDKWHSFATNNSRRLGLGTLVMLVREQTGDPNWQIPPNPVFVETMNSPRAQKIWSAF